MPNCVYYIVLHVHTVCMYNIYIYIHTYMHVCLLCVTNRLKLCVLCIYTLCYPHPKKLYSSPPKPTIYIYIHDHDYICQRARFPQLPLLCFLVMLPVEQPLLTNGCSPTLGLLLMTSSFPCSTSYISSCIIYIYISKRGVNWYHDLSMCLFYNLLRGPSTR